MPTITKVPKLVTVINVFIIDPADQKKLVDLILETAEKVINKFPGFISSSVHKSTDGRRVVTYSQWRSRDDVDMMMENAEIQAVMSSVRQIADSDLHLYEVVETFESDRQPSIDRGSWTVRSVHEQHH
jgi:quinol monooxygenase YgiN